MTQELAAYGYLIAAICFIMALRGLSSPVTSRQGNLYGVIGMVVAIGVTIATPGVVSPWLIVGGLLLGGAIGALVAMRIQMTALPQLVAAFHSLVGLAAVFVAAAAFVSPDAFGIGSPGHIKTQSLIEMGLGTIIGAITFTGSVVAFAKLQGLVTGSPLVFRGQHPINALLGIALVVLLVWFAMRGHPITFLLLIGLSLALGFLLILPIGGADMPVVVSMLNSYSGWAAAGIGFTLGNTALIVTGALVGSSGA
ncbi:MAG TPA: NAD(P)(+) transhydrogenase (Re/Si-specific) subunit beta, partial [Reyranella sp.]|nr:NAD(P)(+) transhydrogenase (Re/Si-specific) subunit beta [Reyranella sp.]